MNVTGPPKRAFLLYPKANSVLNFSKICKRLVKSCFGWVLTRTSAGLWGFRASPPPLNAERYPGGSSVHSHQTEQGVYATIKKQIHDTKGWAAWLASLEKQSLNGRQVSCCQSGKQEGCEASAWKPLIVWGWAHSSDEEVRLFCFPQEGVEKAFLQNSFLEGGKKLFTDR